MEESGGKRELSRREKAWAVDGSHLFLNPTLGIRSANRTLPPSNSGCTAVNEMGLGKLGNHHERTRGVR